MAEIIYLEFARAESPSSYDMNDSMNRQNDRDPEKWSARQTLLFVVITCASFWGAVYLAFKQIL